tara:strand:+ start:58 stop:429 length:372 start_codon:yes stop_codon:yes gene_type:complete
MPNNGRMNQTNPKKISASDLKCLLQKDPTGFFLVDVREDKELELAPFPAQVFHFPLSRSSDWLNNFQNQLPNTRPVVVICHAGIRSWNFGVWLIEQDLGYEVWNLEGGIDSWSLEVDPSVPRY